MLRRHSLERRLFGWMLALALVPALALVLAGAWLWAGSLEWVGTLGPWDRVAESGRVVFEVADSVAPLDSALVEALGRHREELSASLRLARRWEFIGARVASLVPVIAMVLALVLAWAALVASRRVARGLARPIGELVGWAGMIAREEPLPAAAPSEVREVVEVRALRAAFRRAETELAAARSRALEAERIRIWGEMARRVAHEMKNPLTPLRLAAHRLARSSEGGSDWEEPLTVIAEETDRLEELARQFAAVGRPPEGPTSAVDMRELLAGLLATDVSPGVEAALEADPELPLVEGHYEALVRAFRNLVRNAVEAMEGSDAPRRIQVRLTAVAAPEAGVEVTIADTGPGVPEDVRERIFEPDYTTKSRGTGLGLTLVRQAVAAHGGTVTARGRPEGGAEFVVRLPAGTASVAARA